MNKRQKYYIMLFLLLNMTLIIAVYKRKPHEIRVNDRIAGYTYFDRSLSVSDFEQFDYKTTYEDLVDCIGFQNGTIGSGIARPYYELNDGRFVIWNAAYKKSISVVTSKNHEYYILPPQLSPKSDIIRNRQMKIACQSEMNSILWMLDLKTLVIKDYWGDCSENDQKDIALGAYNADLLKSYTNRNITAEISYYFGNEFWGKDGDGKYVCLLSTNPWKTGWGISAENRNTQYYFVQMETLDDAVVSVNVVHLIR